MKRLILVRHAKTEALTDAQSDFERKLKKRGHSDADLVARDLLVRALRPEVLIAVPPLGLCKRPIFLRVFCRCRWKDATRHVFFTMATLRPVCWSSFRVWPMRQIR